MTHRHPYTDPDLREIIDRNSTAQRLVSTFARSAPAISDLWQIVTATLDDTPILVAEIARLRTELARNRLSRANLIAAARATIGASTEGEDDPLYYLRDELAAQLAQPHPRKRTPPDGGS